jgi:phosphodiesterase/alkaline phosphatase D-like protein
LIPTVSCGEAPQGAISIPDPERWIPEVTLDEASFPFGIQIGDATFDSVICSVQTDVVSWKMLLMRVEEGVWVLDRMVELPSSVDGFGQWELDALNPDTLYSIVVFTESGRSSVSEFRTALEIGENRIIRFGATSCLGGNWSWPSLSIAASQRYDFFCFLGDAVYADGSTSKTEYWQHWSRTLSQQGFQDITSSTSLVCTWDDHEVDNNWSWEDEGIDTRFSNAISTFRRALPQREGPDGTGIWRRLDWGETLSLFILDGRGERRDGNYISPEQMDWLKESLRTTTAYFSVILNPVPITDYSTLLGSTQSEDRWEGYEQRAEILSYIEDQDITGVVFVSGDFHFGQICRVSQTGEVGSELHEVLVGPGGSFLNPMGSMIPEGAQFLVGLSEWNYTEFVCDPDLGTIAVSFFSDEGELLAERVISV